MRQADGMFDLSGRLLGASLSLERLWEVMLISPMLAAPSHAHTG